MLQFWACTCLLEWQCISYSSVYITSMMKHETVRKYFLISQLSTNISAVDFSLFLKNCYTYFRVTWLLKLTILDVYICPQLLRNSSDSCWWNRGRTYIHVVGFLNACTVVAYRVQRGRIYKSLTCKGLNKLWLFSIVNNTYNDAI